MATINFTVDITPMPWQRPRFNKNGSVFESKALKEYKQKIADAARKAMGDLPPFTQPVFIVIDFCKHISTDSKQFGDIDNLVKAVLDACNGILYDDDRRITFICSRKFKSSTPRIGVFINTSDE